MEGKLFLRFWIIKSRITKYPISILHYSFCIGPSVPRSGVHPAVSPLSPDLPNFSRKISRSQFVSAACNEIDSGSQQDDDAGNQGLPVSADCQQIHSVQQQRENHCPDPRTAEITHPTEQRCS